MSQFVDKYKTKYPYYNTSNNYCVASTDFHTFKVNPTQLDQIEDVDFWNRSYNYTNMITDNGNTIGLKGVCNPLLVNNCDLMNDDNIGICNTNNYLNTQSSHITYKKNTSPYKKN
jgi:hypothetical protein